jgi:hypothetical protein
LLGADVVVQIVFRHSTVEPRLVEIGLDGDDLVKLLDGENVVLVIKCRAASHQQPVGIELGF